jgi:MinD superfamily P-loop ATPase
MTPSSKFIVFSCGGEVSVGKTTVACAIADYFANRGLPATLFDCDTESKQRGSPIRFFLAEMLAVH